MGNAAPVSIVVLSASEDDGAFDALDRQLSTRRRAGLLTRWSLRDIPGGDDRGEVAQRAIDGAALVVVLVTPHFAASDFLWGLLDHARRRRDAGEGRVVLVRVRPVDLVDPRLDGLQALPREEADVPAWISKRADADEAWHQVAQALDTILALPGAGEAPPDAVARPAPAPPAGAQEASRRRRRLRIAAGVAFGVVAAVAFGAYRAATVQVPNVVGLSLDAAKAIARCSNKGVVLQIDESSDRTSLGTPQVVEQSPPGGARVAGGGLLRLTVTRPRSDGLPADLEQKLAGTWRFTVATPYWGCTVLEGKSALSPNLRPTGPRAHPSEWKGVATQGWFQTDFSVGGTWHVENGYLITDVEVSSTERVHRGDVWRWRILGVDERVLAFVNEADGLAHIHLRE